MTRDLFQGGFGSPWVEPRTACLIDELRELVRFRAKLVDDRTGLKVQVHSVLAKCGISVVLTDIFGPAGHRMLDTVDLEGPYRRRVEVLRGLIEVFDEQITGLDRVIAETLAGHPGYECIQQIPGVGKIIAAVFVAEIGDISRFRRPEQLCSWAGLTPRHHESDTTIIKGRITKQGSRRVRHAAVEAAMRARGDHLFARDMERIAQARGRKIARVSVARKMLTLVFYGLRDHHIRRLEQAA